MLRIIVKYRQAWSYLRICVNVRQAQISETLAYYPNSTTVLNSCTFRAAFVRVEAFIVQKTGTF